MIAEELIQFLQSVPGDAEVVFTEAHGVGDLQVWETWKDNTSPRNPKYFISLAAKS